MHHILLFRFSEYIYSTNVFYLSMANMNKDNTTALKPAPGDSSFSGLPAGRQVGFPDYLA